MRASQFLAAIAASLRAQQEPLGEPYSTILEDHLWELYVRSDPLPVKARKIINGKRSEKVQRKSRRKI